jgi:GNAT superfamily N-acetyltransferase
MKVITTFYRRMLVMTRELDAPIPEVMPGRAVEIRPLTEGNMDAYLKLRPGPPAHDIRARLARGSRCFLAWHQGNIAHVYWAGTGRVYLPYLRRDLVLQPSDFYAYDSYSPPAYRGRGLAQAVGVHVLRLYREDGYRRAWALPAVENLAGIGPVRAIGYRAVGVYGCARLGPWQWTWQEQGGEVPLPGLEPWTGPIPDPTHVERQTRMGP